MTSGDLLADRRMEMARALHGRGDAAAAVDVLEQALDLASDWVAGHFVLAGWLTELGRRDDAVAAYLRCLELDPHDCMGAVLRLALLGAVAAPPSLPPAYVAAVFDHHADDFDSSLLERLDYRVPDDLAGLVGELAGPGETFVRTLDLGCGTGLAGERFRASSSWLEGVDLSEGMLVQARRKGFYDRLEREEATTWLEAHAGRYDLVVAADVLVYVGDLSAIFLAVAAALAPGGRFAFSVEALAGDGFRLNAGHRFAHSETYVCQAAAAAGLEIEAVRKGMCRLEKGVPVGGLCVVTRKPQEPRPGANQMPGAVITRPARR